jgi:hypothetical protein
VAFFALIVSSCAGSHVLLVSYQLGAITIKNGKIVEIDFLADPERIAQLDLTELGD